MTTETPLNASAAASWPAHDPATRRTLPGLLDPAGPGSRRGADCGRVGAVHERHGRLRRAQQAGDGVAAHGRDIVVPALGPVPDLDHRGQGCLAHRRGRPAAARPVDGLRRDARRSPEPRSGGRGDRRDGDRDAVRHALALSHRGRRAVPAALRPGPAALHQLGDRGHHVRGAHRAGLHRAPRHHQDRGRLPRRLRRPGGVGEARRGRVRARARADPGDPVRCRGRHGARRALQRPRSARGDPRRARLRDRGGRDGARPGEHLHRGPRCRLPHRRARGVRPPRRPAGVRRGEDRADRRIWRSVAAPGRHPRPRLPGQECRWRPATGGVRRARRGDGGSLGQPHAALRHLQRQPPGDGRGGRCRRGLHARGAGSRREAQR